MSKGTTTARLILFFIFLVYLVGPGRADAAVEYRIKKGDNPSTIAKKFRVSVDDILGANKITPNSMKPGDRIIIPVKKTAAKKKGKNDHLAKGSSPEAGAGAAQSIGSDSSAVQVQEPVSGNLYHTVKKGDTLLALSKKYSVSVSELKDINDLRSAKLKKGQKLLVNPVRNSGGTLNPAEEQRGIISSRVKRTGPRTYTVKKGDNIWRIAKKFDMDVDDIMEINELVSRDLKVGQKLFLEEKVDAETAESYHKLIAKNFEEDIQKTAESEEFSQKEMPDKVTTFAKKLLNIPYKFGGNSILGIDCSAYVKKVYGFMGFDLPRTAREQFNTGEAIDKDELSIGDLVFFRTYASFPSHVGIYLGNDLFIHASSRGKKVTIDSLETPYYLKRFIGAKRLLTGEEKERDPNS